MEQKPLSSKEFWDERHTAIGLAKAYPRPGLHFLDFELDSVFRKYLSAMKGRRILEVGCGSSVWLPYCRKEFGLEVSGIDYSEAGLRTAREILMAHGAEAELILGDFLEPPEAQRGRFDIVFSLGVIEHFSDPGSILRILGKYLRPGGTIITWVPNTTGWIIRLSRRLNKKLKDFYYDLDLELLTRLHEAAGYKILESRYVQFLDLSHIRIMKPVFLRKWYYRFARLTALPSIWAKGILRISVPSRRLSSGIIVIGQLA